MQPPVLAPFELQHEDFHLVVVRLEAFCICRRDERVAPAHAAQRTLEAQLRSLAPRSPHAADTDASGGGRATAARGVAELWRDAPCAKGGVRGIVPCVDQATVRVGLINGGLEKLAGIVLAHLNRHGSRASRGRSSATKPRDLASCYVQGGVLKVHGGTFRPADVYERLFARTGSGSGGALREPRLSRSCAVAW